MPTYDFVCHECGSKFEARAAMSCENYWCDACEGFTAFKQFSPNANILIPNAFRAVLQGFQGPPGPDSAPYSSNNSVHAPKRQSFTEAFDANYKKAGGIG